MSRLGRGGLVSLVVALLVLLSVQPPVPPGERTATLAPVPALRPDSQHARREAVHFAQAEAMRLRQLFALYVHGVLTGYSFEFDDHFYLPVRQLLTSLGGSVHVLSRSEVQLWAPGHHPLNAHLYSEQDRGYVLLDEVRQLLPTATIGRSERRIDLGSAGKLEPIPGAKGPLRQITLDGVLFSNRALLAGSDLYVPAATSAMHLATAFAYNAAAGTAELAGAPVRAYFSTLPGVDGVPYVKLAELLQRANVAGHIELTASGEVDRPSLDLSDQPANSFDPAGLERTVFQGPGERKRIALTFDDYLGPWIPELLAVLQQADVRATFFAIGSSVQQNPDLARAVVRAGHQMANHTFNHYNLFTMTLAEIRAELAGTRRVIKDVTGVDGAYWRPPAGYVNDAVVEQAAVPLGLTTVLWSVNSNDANPRITPDEVYAAVMHGAFPGAIVAMHMGAAASRKALPRIVADLRAQGYTFVTIDELLTET